MTGVLICMRLRNMHRRHPAQVEGVCAICGYKVGIYPASQAALKRMPDLVIQCIDCTPANPAEMTPTARTLSEFIGEISQSQPAKEPKE